MIFHNTRTSTELLTSTKQELDINFGAKEVKFINELKTLTDTRDNRGKRHSLVILIVTFVFATLVNRSSVSSIHRYMTNKIHWLREITGIQDATVISRAHLPRMLEAIDWLALSVVINNCYGEQIRALIVDEWLSADGKELIGNFYRSGTLYTQEIIRVNDHDFPSYAEGKVIPAILNLDFKATEIIFTREE